MLVQAVRRGIPPGYGTAIANIGFAILHNYTKWKQQVTLMYDERQKQKVFKQMQGIEQYLEKRAGSNSKMPSTKPATELTNVSQSKPPTGVKA